MKREILLLLVTLFCCGGFAAGARAQTTPAPCCSITAIDAKTGVVTAKVNADGRTFQFKVNDANKFKELKVGQGVYANLGGKQVSLDGKSVAGPITSITAASAPAPASTAPEAAATAERPAPATAPAPTAARAPAPAPATAPAVTAVGRVPPVAGGIASGLAAGFQLCCTLDTSGILGQPLWHGTVNGQPASGPAVLGFSFIPPFDLGKQFPNNCANGAASGTQFYANFQTGMLSFDGKTACGQMEQVTYRRTIYLDVLPIGVIYIPPGDPKLTGGSIPSQKFQATTMVTKTTQNVTLHSSGQSMTLSAGVFGQKVGGGTSSTNTVTTSDQHSATQMDMIGITTQGPGYPGSNDVIAFYVNPTYDITYVGEYVPAPGPSAKLAGQIISVVPHPHLPTDPQWVFCHPTAADLLSLTSGAAACLNQIPTPPGSTNSQTKNLKSPAGQAAEKLLQLDPMFLAMNQIGIQGLDPQWEPTTTPASVTANSGPNGRFQMLALTPGAGAGPSSWTYCDDSLPTPFGESNSTQDLQSNTTTTKFNSSVSLTLDPVTAISSAISAVSGVPAGGTSASLNLTVGDTWETDYTLTNSTNVQTTWSTSGQFGGGTQPSSSAACGSDPTSYNTTLYYDWFSSTVLFFTVTVVPTETSYVSGSAPGAPAASEARVVFTPVGGVIQPRR